MPDDAPTATTRSRIIVAAAKLIAEGGAEAATTRAVAIAAEVQAPTIYRLFGDKDGLIDSVAEHVLATFVAQKAQRPSGTDPVEDLRQGWNDYVEFGLAHPALFAIMNAPRSGAPTQAAVAGLAVLRERIRRIAAGGRLRIGEESAVDLIHAAGMGTVLALLQKTQQDRNGLSALAWKSVTAMAINDEPPASDTGMVAIAAALRARLIDAHSLTRGERAFMEELLDRITSGPS